MHSAETNRATHSNLGTVAAAMALAALLALLVAARPAQAQTENVKTEAVLWNFGGTPDGQSASSSLTLYNGNFYGTTYSGGAYGYGSVFEITPAGKESILYSFCPAAPSCTDGANPYYTYVLFDSEGNMYGTAFNGGAHGDGVVFELSPSGESWKETVLYSFANSPDGANPINGLITDKAGDLFGTTYAGGSANGDGTIFEMTRSGNNWTEGPLYSINSNGSALTTDPLNGYIVGTTFTSVFALIPTNTGGYDLKVVYTFNPANATQDGSEPISTPAFDSAGNVYGTTAAGGANNDGVIYKLSQSGNTFKETRLANFGPKFGMEIYSGVVLDSAGNIYGATGTGGVENADAGTIYELVNNNNGTYTSDVIWNFDGEDGAEPVSTPLLSGGYLYGTTFSGGSSGNGTVYVVNPNAYATTTNLVSSVNPSTEGEAVTFTATVTSVGGTPTNGDIVVFEPIGQAPITNGVATYTVSDLNLGTTNVTAVYQGDLNFIKSRSNTVAQVVTK